MDSKSVTFSVAIPTYRRPDYLRRAVESVLAQSRAADEIIVISREDDDATNAAILALIESSPVVPIRNPRVSMPGFLPPIMAAVAQVNGDVLVFLDDDAEAHPDWLARIAKHYDDPLVGGVGGRCSNYFDGVLQHYPPVSKVGTLSWYGRSVGNMYCDCTFCEPVEVSHLMGGNMSYRTQLLRQCPPDERIGTNVAFYWEMDVALQVKHLGFRVLFDPAIVVDHHSAPRETAGLRSINYDGIYWSNFNYALLMRKHLQPVGVAAYLAHTALVGGRASPGIIYVIYSAMRGNPVAVRDCLLASIRGRIAGLRA